MVCELCNEPESKNHEFTPKHVKNLALYQYSLNKKQFTKNRLGVDVTCTVRSSTVTINDSVESLFTLSMKPHQTTNFSFKIKNVNATEEVLIIGVTLASSKLDFVMNDHGMSYGKTPYLLKPNQSVPQPVEVTFKTSNMGEYEMPIMFFFMKCATKETFVIIREMLIYVETVETIHENQKNPYKEEEVKADKLVRRINKNGMMARRFPMPSQLKRIFSCNLTPSESATKEENELTIDIKDCLHKGPSEVNYIKYFHNLLWYEEAYIRINMKKYNMSAVPLVEQGGYYLLVVPGLAEKRPSLMIGDVVFAKPFHNDLVMYEGVITKMESDVIHIGGFDPSFAEHYSPTSRFSIRFFLSCVPLDRMHMAVDKLFKAGQRSRVFPVEAKKVKKVPQIENFYNPLIEENPEQRTAVEHIVAGTSGLAPYMLHGPPGTGKTVTIVEAILQLVKKSSKNRILVCTDSNMAADHVACTLIQYHHMFGEQKDFLLRANSQFRVWETMPERLAPFSNGTSFLSFWTVTNRELDSYKIVVTTLSHAAKYDRVKPRPITHLFIDEAAQAAEPSCLIPVCSLLAENGQLILAGDPMQLGPVVISHNASKLGLGKSLMERLKEECILYNNEKEDHNYTIMLRNNFRSHADILELPNEKFYNGLLIPQAPIDPLSSTDILGERETSRAIVFHGVCSKEQRIGKSPSYYNQMELQLVQTYITALTKNHKVEPENIGVVTPYIRQVYKVKEWLCQAGYGNRLEVGTVEAFQGKEKRVIIISTVRANASLLDHDARFQLGFLVDDKRFNVAITRAKAKVIIIGNPLCLQKDKKWLDYMEKCREYGTYFGFEAPGTTERREDVQILDYLRQLTLNPPVPEVKRKKGRKSAKNQAGY